MATDRCAAEARLTAQRERLERECHAPGGIPAGGELVGRL